MNTRHVTFVVTSPGCVAAGELDKVAALASGLGAQLELFHCAYDARATGGGRFGLPAAQEDVHAFVERRREQLEPMAQRLRAQGLAVRISVRWDYPVHEGIVRHVLRRRPALLIAQSSRRTRAARLMLTQTDYKLIETCPCPVLLIKTASAYATPLILAAVDPARSHGKPSSLDDGILSAAATMRAATQGTLHVLHAGASWEEAIRKRPDLQDLPAAVQEDIRGAWWNGIREQVSALARRHAVTDDCVEVIEGEAAELVPRVAHSHSAAIVALGAVSRSALGRALIGHTAERVLDALECDVLIVKPADFRTPVSRESTHRVVQDTAQVPGNPAS